MTPQRFGMSPIWNEGPGTYTQVSGVLSGGQVHFATMTTSDRTYLRTVTERQGVGAWKHYEFDRGIEVAEDGMVLFSLWGEAL